MITPTTESNPLIEARGVRVHFPISLGLGRRLTLKAVDGVNLALTRGETVGLVGESGSGKSTLGRALLGLRTLSAGSVHFDGAKLSGMNKSEIRHLRRQMQMVSQDPYGSLNPLMSIGTTLAEPIRTHGLRQGTDAIKARVYELLDLVGLTPDMAARHPQAFSGGQRQRIAIARALASEPEFIMCDEPISALDVSVQAQVLNLLINLQRDMSLTYLFVSHDLAVVRRIADRIAVMYLGKVVEMGNRDAVYARPAHPYTIALMSAIPVPDPKVERSRKRIILTGDIPSAVSPPPGCPFHTRCWRYRDMGKPSLCHTQPPVPQSLDQGHEVACHFPVNAVEQRPSIAANMELK